MKLQTRLLWTALAAALSACGGGGGGDSAAATSGSSSGTGAASTPGTGSTGTTAPPGGVSTGTAGFSLRAAYGAHQLTGFDDAYVVSGSCSGSARSTGDRAQATVFEGIAAFAQQQVASIHFTNCSPADSVGNSTSYYDRRAGTEFIPVGFSGTNVYSIATTVPVLPDTVKVGNSGNIASFALYADATKTTLTGRRTLDYVIEADTATSTSGTATAIVNLVTRDYDVPGALTSTTQARLRIDTAGTLTAVSGDIVYDNGVHLILTR